MRSKNIEPKNPVGRPPKMAGGKRRNIYIDDASWQKAKALGNGTPSEGIRVALDGYTKKDGQS